MSELEKYQKAMIEQELSASKDLRMEQNLPQLSSSTTRATEAEQMVAVRKACQAALSNLNAEGRSVFNTTVRIDYA